MRISRALVAALSVVGVMAATSSPALADVRTAREPEVTPVVATFDVVGEIFRVKFTDPQDIKRAKLVFAGKDPHVPHPNGRIVYGEPDVNLGYSWHLSPVRWSDMSTEVCDGRPSSVEQHKITSPYYCPFLVKLIALD